MGSGGSKARPGSETAAATSSSGGRRGKSRVNCVFRTSCLGSASGSHDRDDDDEQVCSHRNRNRCDDSCPENSVTEGVDQVNASCYKVLEDKDSSEKDLCTSPDVDLGDCGEARVANGIASNQAPSARTSSSPSRVFSHFRFIPGNISSRLSRASSWRSPISYAVPSSSLSMLNDLEDPCSEIDETEHHRGNGLSPVSRLNRAIIQDSEATSVSGPRSNTSTVHVTDGFHADQRMSSPDTARTANHWDGIETRHPNRRIGDREPFERNVRFSRTLSVGRLRDRVLRRSSLSDFAFQLPGEIGNDGTGGGIHNSVVQTSALPAEEIHGPSSSSISRPMSGHQDRDADALGLREASYRDLLEHRSNFFERRRRIRSQVRALRRLGSGFENVPGHDRACALSRQNRTGRCTCRGGNHNTDSTDESGGRASVSRIVMLAEALFEVLDEIHQQSVVSSSQPSVSSIGSIPAPSDVVDSLPVKPYSKSQRQRHEDAAQCYICLVEYEEGDSIRILPCHHEFHRNCVDKWLKEIHRVCPLCRGDICKSSNP